MQHVNDFLTYALRCSYMFRNLHLQGQTMQFLQSENHDNHYHHLCNVTFPRPDCRVDIFRCKTNIWVAVCIADAVQTASLFPRSEARPALRPTLPTYSLHFQGFYLILCMNLLWIRWHIRQIKFFAPNMKTFWLFNGWFLFLPVNSAN